MSVQQGGVAERPWRASLTLDSSLFFAIAVGFELSLIMLVSVAAGVLHHQLVYGRLGLIADYVAVGGATGVLFALPFLIRGQYAIETLIVTTRGPRAIFNAWSYAFLCLAFLAFMTKTTDLASRGWIFLFYVGGLLTVIAVDRLLHSAARLAIRWGWVSPRRVLIVGWPSEMARVRNSIGSEERGVRVVGAVPLPDDERTQKPTESDLEAALELAVELGRQRAVSEVVIALPLNETVLAGRVAARLAELPIAVHLGQLGIFSEYTSLKVARVGALTTLAIAAPPLSSFNAIVKRAFDVVAACLAIVLLAPLMLLVVAAVKLDSPGPVLFRQRRRGFNQNVFEIWKFRTMTTQDDGDVVIQAKLGDARITRVGRLLRRTNLDELPQLFQVVSGKMSLVGPRPHALAHDKHYEQLISHYARRLNVKPGITGWAQINGCRGATRRDGDMHRRVQHDLYYIDNWSFPLDLYILALTVLSPRAYRNAY